MNFTFILLTYFTINIKLLLYVDTNHHEKYPNSIEISEQVVCSVDINLIQILPRRRVGIGSAPVWKDLYTILAWFWKKTLNWKCNDSSYLLCYFVILLFLIPPSLSIVGNTCGIITKFSFIFISTNDAV